MIHKTHEVVDASPGEGYVAPDMSIDIEPWATSFIAEVLDSGRVVVWPDETPEYAAELLELISGRNKPPVRHYFMVDVTLTPAKEFHDIP